MGIEAVIKDEAESGRLAGFGASSAGQVDLFVHKDEVEKAKEARLKAIQAYLELKEIKNKYMIEEINDDEDENFPNFDF